LKEGQFDLNEANENKYEKLVEVLKKTRKSTIIQEVRIPYYTENDKFSHYVHRFSLTNRIYRFYQEPYTPPMLYGLWRLKNYKGSSHIILVEGESDAQTLWYLGHPDFMMLPFLLKHKLI
jgi:hypothetical protein